MPPAFFLHFSPNVDVTGIGTFLLAVATAVLAGYTRRSVDQAGQELEQSQRPVIVPVAGISVRPRIDSGDRFLLPLKNVGVGPAMDVSAEIDFGDVEGNGTAAPPVWASAEITAIGANETVMLEFRDVPLREAMGFAFYVVYHDVSGKGWYSCGGYSEVKKRFRDVAVVGGTLSEVDKYRIHSRIGHA